MASIVLPPGYYVLIPCTHEAGHAAKYGIIFYSPSVLTVEKSPVKGTTSTRRGLESRAKTVSGKKGGEEEKEKAALAVTQIRLKKENDAVKTQSCFGLFIPASVP